MIRTVLMIFALAGTLTLAGCNTVRGVGQDIESVADAGDDAI